LTGRKWPRLAGSDLMEPVLDVAAAYGLSVGFLGGRLRLTLPSRLSYRSAGQTFALLVTGHLAGPSLQIPRPYGL
jgi:UDP-N-acetyl-D-mannosaminuronic acid transferase (WecB/TagA/CpsF family)